jgi:hypothetical protein
MIADVRMKIMSYSSFFICGILLAGCMAGERDKSISELRLPSVYERYLLFPVPSQGIEAQYNPPVLRWPVQKGEDVRYDVRLSMDSSFSGETFTLLETPWAMFNPHRKLSPGAWHWQYRVSGRGWSKSNRFIVGTSAVDLVSPPAGKFLNGIATTHPRLLTDPEGLKNLRAIKGDADAADILRQAKAILMENMARETDGLPKRSETDNERNKKLKQDAGSTLAKRVYTQLVGLCQAWILSGDDAYRRRAIAISTEVATWDPAGVTGSKTSDFADARCMLAMAIVFDTFHSHLSLSQKSALQTAIKKRAAPIYHAWINNQEARLLSGHVWQHILHYFFETSLALYGHEPDASAWLSYAYELFLARAPILGGKDGGWTEGASYFRMNIETLINVPLFIREYTGFDFIKSHPWYVNNGYWLAYHVPPGSSSDGFGDNAEEVFSPGVEYIAFAQEIAKLTGNRLASWYASKCIELEQIDLSSQDILRWVRLAKTRGLPMPPANESPGLSSGKLFSQIGLASMHSLPEDPPHDLMLAMRSSPFGSYGHFLSDQNAFNILYGGKRTFFRTGYKVTMTDPHRTGWYQHTKSNNSVLVDGEGQPYSTEAFGWIRRFIPGKRVSYALADASNAYRSVENDEDYGVRKFYRHILLLEPDIIVIYDELENEADAEWSWLIHSMSPIEVDRADNSFKSLFKDVRGVGKLWSSDPIRLSVTDTFEVPAVNWRGSRDATGKLKKYEAGQWHLKAVTVTKNKRERFLAVLQISPQADTGNVRDEDDEGLLKIIAGDWTISATLESHMAATLTVSDAEGNVHFLYDADGNTAVFEMTEGKKEKVVAHDVVPWDLKQSLLYHTNSGSIKAQYGQQK